MGNAPQLPPAGKEAKPSAPPPKAPQPMVFGSWPANCQQRAFVDGVAWAMWKMKIGTLFQSERNAAEAEAVRRYGPP